MRGVRIAAFSLAAILMYVVISNLFTVEPADGDDSQNAGVEATQGTDQETAPPVVPEPPPLPGAPPAHPARKLPLQEPPAPENVAQALPGPEPQLAPAAPDVYFSSEDTKPVVWPGDELTADSEDVAGSPTGPIAEAKDDPAGPVIVVPQERAKEESRGSRWLRAVGHALGIGRPKGPVEQAFQ